jgi:hypothetical protein
MAGPAQVRFPGEDKRRKVKMRGIKKASDTIQRRLKSNLNELLDEPEKIIPTRHENGQFPRKDALKKTVKQIEKVINKRNDLRWLQKRMSKRRGDAPAKALAGSLAAAHEEEFSTVSIFENPAYGKHSYLRRGMASPTDLASVQNQNHVPLRLLLWREHAKSGLWFFGGRNQTVCTGISPLLPNGWVSSCLKSSPIKLLNDDETKNIWHTKGISIDEIKEQLPTDEGWVRLQFNDGITVGIHASQLNAKDAGFVGHLSLRMLPPKLLRIAHLDWVWIPKGWPVEQSLPDVVETAVDEILESWADLKITDNNLIEKLKGAVTSSIDEGFVLSDRWFAEIEDGVNAIDGTNLEREAIKIAINGIENGIHIRKDGVVLSSPEDVVRIEMRTGHEILSALWVDYGYIILEDMFGITGTDAEKLHSAQLKRKQGFNAFLKSIDAQRKTRAKLDSLPWIKKVLPNPLNFAHELICKAHADGLGSTTSLVRKRSDVNEAAIGWAWLSAHDKAESEAWRFDEVARDKGGDWVRKIQNLWDESVKLIDGNGSKIEYQKAMKSLAKTIGVNSELPDIDN